MNFEKQLEKLAVMAQKEQLPNINVATAVLGAIAKQAGGRQASAERQLMWVAVVSSAAAAMIMVAAIATYYNYSNAITEVSDAISWVIQ